ncbi:MAG: Uma2 family endonuclease [Tannerella sp.]|jgi:Uma2 family endonuclease|nr:Uma2 family endonuclease [Tannerella sp.]
MELTLDMNKRYTYADYLTWLDDKRRELVNGFIHLMAAPRTAHEAVSISLTTDITNFIRKNNCKCRVFGAPFDVRLPQNGERKDNEIYTVVQPDVCLVCDPSKLDVRGCLGAPDLMVEILSPSSRRYDLDKKLHLYERSGVKEYWVISPETPDVNVFLPDEDGTYGDAVVYAPIKGERMLIPVSVLPGLEIDTDLLFRDIL